MDQHQRDRKRQPIMQAQFGGKLTTQIVCRSVPYRSEKDEDFVQAGRLAPCGSHKLDVLALPTAHRAINALGQAASVSEAAIGLAAGGTGRAWQA